MSDFKNILQSRDILFNSDVCLEDGDLRFCCLRWTMPSTHLSRVSLKTSIRARQGKIEKKDEL